MPVNVYGNQFVVPNNFYLTTTKWQQ